MIPCIIHETNEWTARTGSEEIDRRRYLLCNASKGDEVIVDEGPVTMPREQRQYYQATFENSVGDKPCVRADQETEDPRQVASFRCNCRHPWLRELHGVNSLMMVRRPTLNQTDNKPYRGHTNNKPYRIGPYGLSNSSNSIEEKIFWTIVIAICMSTSIYMAQMILRGYSTHQSSTLIIIYPAQNLTYPTLVFCPKYPDHLNYSAITEDMGEHMGYLEDNTRWDIIRYMIAGSGFDNVKVEKYDDNYKAIMNEFYNRWRGNRTILEMFDFVFNQNGIHCSEMFDSCYGGSRTLNCCDIFEPTYVMTRGRCFRLVNGFAQVDVDESDKLSIFFKEPDSPLIGINQSTQVVMYTGDENPEVAIFPRFYLNLHDWNRIRLSQRKIFMLDNEGCSLDRRNQGKSTCFVYTWLKKTVIDRFNCTLPYFAEILSFDKNVPVCELSVIVDNYASIMSNKLNDIKCLPACHRVQNNMQITTSVDFSPNPQYAFRIEVSFTNLEIEEYREVRTTTLAGFISELGGQSGLFVGCSVMTFVQLLQGTTTTLYRLFKRVYDKHARLPVDVYFQERYLRSQQ